ncbi:MAG TPA: zinc-dependent alcohol dehydrogenase family protein [Candidatus Aminicenantes bacterium]|nr:zinc-dependent alcohol dehydrogenase family protein [Candidatus Aminicenantes bacterium]HRY66030.1 zinc-dependent alcohol dehydrogenase family protein [Candidatus Aminicenantes bacterium]HRZ72921.1 zinc-dependent alcohol dehydrogenase family protein [Candidatus Aminicenantes bacterium]
MKAAVFTAPKQVEVRDVPIPEIKDDEVLIKVKAVGLCGTDIHIFKGEYFTEFPVIPGHEFSGVVDRVGRGVRYFKEGDRVTADPNVFCEACYFCKRNLQNHCEDLRVIGVSGCQANGAFAEYVAVPFKNVFPLDDAISFTQGAFVEPLACVAHGLDLAGIRFGSDVLVVGAGPIGLLLLQSLKAAGAARVVVLDLDAEKLRMARELGADLTFAADGREPEALKAVAPRGFDYVVDATGIPAIIEKSFAYLKKAGTFLVFGVCPKDSKISVNPYEIFLNDWKIVGSFAIRKNFHQSILMLSSGKVRTDPLLSLRYPLEKFPELLSRKMSQLDLMKVQISFE